MGRLPVNAHLEELSLEDLEKILITPKNAIAKQYEALFSFEGVTFEITDDGRRQIALLAQEKKNRSQRAQINFRKNTIGMYV